METEVSFWFSLQITCLTLSLSKLTINHLYQLVLWNWLFQIRNLFLYFDFELNLYDLSVKNKINKYYLRQYINIFITKCQDEHNIFIIWQVGTYLL